MRNSVQNLTNLLKSKVQCIWIKTYEEEQVINDIKNIVRCNFPKTKVNSWSFFSGLQYEPLSKNEKTPDSEIGISPDKLLDIILKNQVKDKNENFWILKDFHLNIETKSIIRGIRDIKDSSKENTKIYNPIIILSPIINIPIELEKLFTIVDYSLPDKEEIKLYIEKYVEQISNNEKFITPGEEEIKSCIDLAQGLTINEIIGYIKRSLVEYKTISQKIFFQARLDLLKKTGILEYQECNTSLDEMGGNGCFKHWISDIKECFEPEAEAFGVTKPKGFLGVGIPGTSKTMSAQIIASTLKLPLLQFKMSSVMHSHVGQSEKNMENALNIIKACSPCVLLIDEIEKTLSGM